jgi:TRAP-type mannitol/chloroaromatic compound transport system substrate-binding protein
MVKRLLVFLVAVVTIVGLLVAGCAPEAAPEEEAPPEEEEPTPPEEEEEPAAPEAEVFKWVGQSHAGGITQQHHSLQRVAERVDELSNGRLKMTVEVGGGIAPAAKEFDAVDKGVLDFAVTCFMYWMDKFPAGGLFTMKSGGMSPCQALCWYREGGGHELAEEMVEGYSVRILPDGGWLGPPEAFLQTNKKLNTLDDLEGLQIRAAGDGGEILSRCGAGVVMMPAGEIFESMQRGVIDAFECASPTLNWDLGLYEAADYLYLSGVRQPYELNPFICNEQSWSELPNDLKAILTEVNIAELSRSYAELTRLDLEAIAKFEDYGTEVLRVPEAVEEGYSEEAREFYSDKAAEDAFIAKVLESYDAFQENFNAVWACP